LSKGKLPVTPVKEAVGNNEIVAVIGDDVPQSSNEFLSAFGAEDDEDEDMQPTPSTFNIAGDEVDGPDEVLTEDDLLLTAKVQELVPSPPVSTPSSPVAAPSSPKPDIGHVMRFFSKEDGVETLIDVPLKVADGEVDAEASRQAADLEESKTDGGVPSTYKDMTVRCSLLASVCALLISLHQPLNLSGTAGDPPSWTVHHVVQPPWY
jgi:hypothetical protein